MLSTGPSLSSPKASKKKGKAESQVQEYLYTALIHVDSGSFENISGGYRSFGQVYASKQSPNLEADNDNNHENEHQAYGHQHALAIPRLLHDLAELLLGSLQPTVRYVHVLVQLVQQALLQSKLLVDCQCNVLQTQELMLNSSSS